MTDEEKKAIEYIDKIVSDCENHWKQLGYTCNLYDGDEPIPVDVYKTVLNLIEKQQAEIEKYKEMYATSIATRVNEAFKQEYKNNEDLEMLYKGCQIETEKKEAIINLMAEQLAVK